MKENILTTPYGSRAAYTHLGDWIRELFNDLKLNKTQQILIIELEILKQNPEESQFAGLRIVKYHVEIEIQILRSNSIQMSVLPF